MPTQRCAEVWTTLAEWDRPAELILALDSALQRLDGIDRDAVLYDYVDPDAVTAAFDSPASSRGATELRFECERHEIRITSDGTVQAATRTGARPDPAL